MLAQTKLKDIVSLGAQSLPTGWCQHVSRIGRFYCANNSESENESKYWLHNSKDVLDFPWVLWEIDTSYIMCFTVTGKYLLLFNRGLAQTCVSLFLKLLYCESSFWTILGSLSFQEWCKASCGLEQMFAGSPLSCREKEDLVTILINLDWPNSPGIPSHDGLGMLAYACTLA